MNDRSERMSVFISQALLCAYALTAALATWSFPIPNGQIVIYSYFWFLISLLLFGSVGVCLKELLFWRKSSGELKWFECLIIPLAISTVALASRFYGLEKPAIWSDEDLQFSQVFQLRDAIFSSIHNQQPPITYFAGIFFADLFGINLWSTRFFSAVTGGLAIWPFFSWLRGYASRGAALLGAMLFLFSTLLWSLSVEGRPYMAAIFVFAISQHLLSAAIRRPDQISRWIGLGCAYALLHLTLSMQPYFLIVVYLLIILCLPQLRKSLPVEKICATAISACLFVFPISFMAILSFAEADKFQWEVVPGIWLRYWAVLFKSYGWIAGIFPLICFFAIFTYVKNKSLILGKEAEAFSQLALAAVFPITIFFILDLCFSFPVRLRYIALYSVMFLFALSLLADRISPRYRLAALVAILAFFIADNIRLPSQKREEPTWLNFYHYFENHGGHRELAFALNFEAGRQVSPGNGFIGLDFYRPLISDLSLRNYGDLNLSFAEDTLRRLIERPTAPAVYFYLPKEGKNYALSMERVRLHGLQPILSGPDALVFKLTTEGEVIPVMRKAMRKMVEIEPALNESRDYRDLIGVISLLEKKCDKAANFLVSSASHAERNRFLRLAKISGVNCAI